LRYASCGFDSRPRHQIKSRGCGFDGHNLFSFNGLSKLIALLDDERHPCRIVHELVALVRQRLFAIAMGCEDTNDAETLRRAWRCDGQGGDSVAGVCCEPATEEFVFAATGTATLRGVGP
jgi:hypothetical protein